MTPYASEDEDCKDDDDLPDIVDRFEVSTMLVADTFNPYTYHETGYVQSSTRFDGDYLISPKGFY